MMLQLHEGFATMEEAVAKVEGPYKTRTGHSSRTGACSILFIQWPAASVWTCTGHTGRTGRILYTWPYYTPSKGLSNCPKCYWKARTVPIGCHSKHASAVELLKLLIRYNNPVDDKGENAQQ